MKRLVERRKLLPAFSLSRAEVQVLWGRIESLFNKDQTIRKTIVVWPAEDDRLEFESIEELLAYREARGEAVRFKLVMEQGGRAIRIESHISLFSIPFLEVVAETDTWCAGAFEAVLVVVRRNRRWYGWIPMLLLPAQMALLAVFFYAPLGSNRLMVTGVLGVSLIALAYLTIRKDRLLPSASIIFTEEHGFLRRYTGELGLALALIGIVLSLLMWLYPVAA